MTRRGLWTALALAGLAGSIASPVSAVEHWAPFFMLKTGVVYVDSNSVQHDGGQVRLATELWYETPPDLRGMKLNYVRSEVRLICQDRTFVILSQRFFGMDGQQLGANLHPSEAKDAPRGTFESALITAYCKPRGDD